MTDAVLARVLALKTAPLSELKTMWRSLFDQDTPTNNRLYLESRLAYRIQELAYGGLPAATVKRLHQLGEQLDGGKQRIRSRRANERPPAGTRLLRDWQGKTFEVLVQNDHFEFNGVPYKSLSAVAKAITGTQWNGWAFFGLRSTKGLT